MRKRQECFGLLDVDLLKVVDMLGLHVLVGTDCHLHIIYILYSGSGPRCAAALVHGERGSGSRIPAALKISHSPYMSI